MAGNDDGPSPATFLLTRKAALDLRRIHTLSFRASLSVVVESRCRMDAATSRSMTRVVGGNRIFSN